MENNLLNFSIDYWEVLKQDKYLVLVDMYIVALESDNYWKTWFTKDNVNKALPSLYNKPIVAVWDQNAEGFNKGDFKEHSRTVFDKKMRDSIGVIPESCNPEYIIVDGKEFLKCRVVLWKYYYEEMVNKICLNSINGNDTKISMEIAVTKMHDIENGYKMIDDFIFMGIAVLGDKYTPAIEGAKIQVIKYSTAEYDKMVEDTNKMLFQYSIKNEMEGETKMLNSNQIREIINNDLSKYKYKHGDYEYCKYYVMAYDASFVYVEDGENGYQTYRIPYKLDEETLVAVVSVESAEKVINGGFIPVKEGEEVKTYAEIKEDVDTYAKEIEEIKQEYAKYKEEFSVTQESYSTVNSELGEISDKYSKLVETYSTLTGEHETTIGELTVLKEYKFSKEKDELKATADEFISKYSAYVTEEEKQPLYELLFSTGLEAFKKETSSLVLPKIEALNEQLKFSKKEDSIEINYSTIPTIVGNVDNKTQPPKDSFERLKLYADSNK